MKCPKCGKEQNENLNFCGMCGTPLVTEGILTDKNSSGDTTIKTNSASVQHDNARKEQLSNSISNFQNSQITIKALPISSFITFALIGGIFGWALISSLFNSYVLGFIIVGFCIYYFRPKTKQYIPNVSFSFIRKDRKELRQYAITAIVILVVLFIILFIAISNNNSRKTGVLYLRLFFLTCGLVYSFYILVKSSKIHEDVDFVSTDEIEKILGKEIDERVVASYQNFDESEVDKFVIAVTIRHIYFAKSDSNKWIVYKKLLRDIQQIGISPDYQNWCINDFYLEIVFNDGSKISALLKQEDKLSSTPNLFLKRFLATIDDMLAGANNRPSNNNNRRRVVSNHKTNTPQPPAGSVSKPKVENHTEESRFVDLSDDNEIISNKTDDNSSFGRNIDL